MGDTEGMEKKKKGLQRNLFLNLKIAKQI